MLSIREVDGLMKEAGKARKDDLDGTEILAIYQPLSHAVHPKELYLFTASCGTSFEKLSMMRKYSITQRSFEE